MSLQAVSSVEAIAEHIAPLNRQLAEHPLYRQMHSLADLRLFMESHVFAVWDFMSLLKALQRTLTCVDVPWVPTASPISRRFINEIVLGEESDEYNGRAVSHFELYLEAMAEAGADTAVIRRIVDSARGGFDGLNLNGVPAAAQEFVTATFAVIREQSAAAQAAAFAFGREDAIPEMFRALVRGLNYELGGSLDTFVWYLERHIELDGDDHGPLALKIVADLCGDDPVLWDEAAQAAEDALRARIRLWDGVLAQIQAR
ncbi:MAG TPA: DUF3050 domain-containing protein [Granulicella sp.]